MVEVKKANGVVILASVPSCPDCGGAVRKLFYEKEMFYRCPHCKSMFRIKNLGHYEHEMICEKVETIHE